VFVCIALIGLILPISWSLNIPNVYEAAIGAGQFFLLGGMYFVLLAIEQDSAPRKWNLFFAGIFWACAVGSRTINVFSVIFLVASTSFWIAKRPPKPTLWAVYLRSISALYIPLVLGAMLIGWYNWARFDSPLEFGLRYQITIFNLNKDTNLIFKPDYFLLNTFVYIFQPFEIISKFPFIQPITASVIFRKFGIMTPHLYAAGRATGFIFGAPFLLFSLAHLSSKNKVFGRGPIIDPRPYGFMIHLLAGSFLINFLSLLLYYFGQMRFLVDVISQITLLAITGYWQTISHKEQADSTRSKFMVHLANILIVVTICAGFLLALTSETSRLETLNPALFDSINSALSIPK
jgi:hypothetical protein